MPSGLTNLPALGVSLSTSANELTKSSAASACPAARAEGGEVFQLPIGQLPGVALGRIDYDQSAGLDLQFLRE